MNRVSIRTLVLTTELLVIFLAYQYLESMSPAKAPGTTCAVKLDDTGPGPASANASEDLATPAGDPPWSTDGDTLALQHAVCGSGDRANLAHREIGGPE
jgi:hypothetical protein